MDTGYVSDIDIKYIVDLLMNIYIKYLRKN